jgi:signal transduction histidine kinase
MYGNMKRIEAFKNSGIGLGLAYCKETVLKMNGDIYCTS